jgi:hypothetical protein
MNLSIINNLSSFLPTALNLFNALFPIALMIIVITLSFFIINKLTGGVRSEREAIDDLLEEMEERNYNDIEYDDDTEKYY